ncbi:methyl-accepting chemotaxis protein [Photobacterium minamisatsumaniensis]|uniref:methyl-accepting chemotaxis protein n=1 Tax=Photobacterium minamisatsumaniensis TaxID=2910233 RepID=UPI003D126D87
MSSLLIWIRKITNRLIVTIAIAFCSIAFVGYEGLTGLNLISNQTALLVEDDLAKIITISDIQQRVEQARVHSMLAIQHDPSGISANYHEHPISNHTDLILDSYDDLQALFFDLMAFNMGTSLAQTATRAESLMDEIFFSGFEEVVDLLADEDFEQANLLLLNTINPSIEQLKVLLNSMNDLSATEARDAYASSVSSGQRFVFSMTAALILSTLILVAIAFVTVRRIVFALKGLQSTANSIANGDLTCRAQVNGQDEFTVIADAVNQIAASFQQTVSLIGHSATELSSVSQQNTNLSKQTASNAASQQTQIQQIATATEELTATVSDVAASAVAAAEASQQSDDLAQSGLGIVNEAITQSIELAQEIEHAKVVINELGQHSQDIGSVSDTIRDISDQTNLLALNAAIEAARAGSYGRGFAVVADEVRSLAQRTKDATQDIQNMIARLQTGCQQAIERMDSGDQYARESTEKTKQAGDSLKGITETVASIAEKNIQIASAAEQQAVVTADVNTNVYEINTLADKTALDSESSQTASQSIAELAKSLSSEVKRFTV